MREPREVFDSPGFDKARANRQTLHDLKEVGGQQPRQNSPADAPMLAEGD